MNYLFVKLEIDSDKELKTPCVYTGSMPRRLYERHYGLLPRGMSLLHRCDHGACINPRHWWIGSQKQNMEDMVSKGRADNGGGNRKITIEQVNVIRSSDKSIWDLMKKHSLSYGEIKRIKTRRRWKSA